MWHALKAELAYARSWIVGGLGLAVGVATLVSVIFHAVGDQGPPQQAAAGIRAMFLIMAPIIVGFIVQAYRLEERRVRLLMACPLTPLELAGVAVLVPVILAGVGVLAAAVMIGAEAAIKGTLAAETLNLVGFVGGMLFMGTMIGLLIQEALAAHRQRRRRAATAGWACLAVVSLFLTTVNSAAAFFQGPMSWPLLHLGSFVVAVMAMVASIALYAGRTDFTR